VSRIGADARVERPIERPRFERPSGARLEGPRRLGEMVGGLPLEVAKW